MIFIISYSFRSYFVEFVTEDLGAMVSLSHILDQSAIDHIVQIKSINGHVDKKLEYKYGENYNG